MLIFTITISVIMSALLTVQQIRIDFYRTKYSRSKKRIESLKQACDNYVDTVTRLNFMLTESMDESDRKGRVINYFDHVLNKDENYQQAVKDLKGGEE